MWVVSTYYYPARGRAFNVEIVQLYANWVNYFYIATYVVVVLSFDEINKKRNGFVELGKEIKHVVFSYTAAALVVAYGYSHYRRSESIFQTDKSKRYQNDSCPFRDTQFFNSKCFIKHAHCSFVEEWNSFLKWLFFLLLKKKSQWIALYALVQMVPNKKPSSLLNVYTSTCAPQKFLHLFSGGFRCIVYYRSSKANWRGKISHSGTSSPPHIH